jgi:hypothetical protein
MHIISILSDIKKKIIIRIFTIEHKKLKLVNFICNILLHKIEEKN